MFCMCQGSGCCLIVVPRWHAHELQSFSEHEGPCSRLWHWPWSACNGGLAGARLQWPGLVSPGSGRVWQRMCNSADPLFLFTAVSDETFRLHAAQCEEIEASKGVKGAFRGVCLLAFTCLRNSMPGPASLYRRREAEDGHVLRARRNAEYCGSGPDLNVGSTQCTAISVCLLAASITGIFGQQRGGSKCQSKHQPWRICELHSGAALAEAGQMSFCCLRGVACLYAGCVSD